MKQLHRPDLWCWSQFDRARNLDFHSYAWIRQGGNVVVDPVPLSDHDCGHLRELGGVEHVVVTNSDHLRATDALVQAFGADVVAPKAELGRIEAPVARWLEDGDEVVPGLRAVALNGSKTPGELALVLEPDTLITGDLVRSFAAGRLHLLPDAKLCDKQAALASLSSLVEQVPGLEAVLVGDGWPVFRDGKALLTELLREAEA